MHPFNLLTLLILPGLNAAIKLVEKDPGLVFDKVPLLISWQNATGDVELCLVGAAPDSGASITEDGYGQPGGLGIWHIANVPKGQEEYNWEVNMADLLPREYSSVELSDILNNQTFKIQVTDSVLRRDNDDGEPNDDEESTADEDAEKPDDVLATIDLSEPFKIRHPYEASFICSALGFFRPGEPMGGVGMYFAPQPNYKAIIAGSITGALAVGAVVSWLAYRRGRHVGRRAAEDDMAAARTGAASEE